MFLTEEERNLTIQGCRFCPMCYHADTAALILRKETNSPRGRGLILHGLDHGVLKWEDPWIGDIFFKSFTDGLPQEWCAGHYDHDELVIDARRRLAEMGCLPEAAQEAVNRVKTSGSPYRQAGVDISGLLREIGATPERGAALLVYLGCSTRSLYPSSARALFRILKALKVSFQTLEDETCCGMPLYRLGDFPGASRQAQKTAQGILQSGARELVVLDADCYRMFMTRYRKFGAFLPEGLKVSHVSEWLADRFSQGALRVRKSRGGATYHDPASLGRFTKIHDAPREVIRSLFDPGLKEMEWSREKAHDCGAGGGMMFTNPDIAREAARRCYGQAQRTGGEVLITASPLCAFQLGAVSSPDLPVRDLVEVAADALS
jgi:Fe-S oxidoreductase